MTFRIGLIATALATGLAAGIVGMTALSGAAQAQSCFDLWYERNLIYAENGYCFSSSLGKRTFANYDCWTKNPDLTRSERNRVAQIQRAERRAGCKVNN